MSTELAQAILFGSIQDVEQLIARGEDVNETDDYGYTPLVESTIANRLEMTELLIKHGAHINEPDTTGRSALHWAAENNNLPLCELLLKKKANPNAYTTGGMPLLTMPVLRHQQQLKQLFYRYGGDLSFAQDFIMSKLVGHRFELQGTANLLHPDTIFIEMEYEGFFLEATMALIALSLRRFKKNYAARHLKQYHDMVAKVIHTLDIADELIKYQHYMTKREQYMSRIDELITSDLLMIPVGYEGHAICLIHYGTLLAKCDRADNEKNHGTVVIYQMQNPHEFTSDFIKYLLYEKKSKNFVEADLPHILNLKPLTQLPLAHQIIGNCSWANIEASIPTMMFLLSMPQYHNTNQFIHIKENCLSYFYQWREWDKDRALEETIQRLTNANSARQVAIGMILANILFQVCSPDITKDRQRAEKILAVLQQKTLRPILQSYVKAYLKNRRDPRSAKFFQLLDICGVDLTQFDE